MNDRIPFNEWSRDKNKKGIKICTSRHDKYLNDDRVTHITPPMPWGHIRTYLYRCEGAESPEELQGVIEAIMKRHVPDTELFYVHFGDFREAI